MPPKTARGPTQQHGSYAKVSVKINRHFPVSLQARPWSVNGVRPSPDPKNPRPGTSRLNASIDVLLKPVSPVRRRRAWPYFNSGRGIRHSPTRSFLRLWGRCLNTRSRPLRSAAVTRRNRSDDCCEDRRLQVGQSKGQSLALHRRYLPYGRLVCRTTIWNLFWMKTPLPCRPTPYLT